MGGDHVFGVAPLHPLRRRRVADDLVEALLLPLAGAVGAVGHPLDFHLELPIAFPQGQGADVTLLAHGAGEAGAAQEVALGEKILIEHVELDVLEILQLDFLWRVVPLRVQVVPHDLRLEDVAAADLADHEWVAQAHHVRVSQVLGAQDRHLQQEGLLRRALRELGDGHLELPAVPPQIDEAIEALVELLPLQHPVAKRLAADKVLILHLEVHLGLVVVDELLGAEVPHWVASVVDDRRAEDLLVRQLDDDVGVALAADEIRRFQFDGTLDVDLEDGLGLGVLPLNLRGH
mmetsp:Transcript_53067/g.146939  ORF Transcript_53067/g.146939 Transcript_53067/m.146939 type:complete len:290 (-) Transcript_53067:25-894(-)